MDNYDVLNDYMGNISEQYNIRQYSDNTFTISAYIGKKHLSIEGSYDLVVMCVRHLYKELYYEEDF